MKQASLMVNMIMLAAPMLALAAPPWSGHAAAIDDPTWPAAEQRAPAIVMASPAEAVSAVPSDPTMPTAQTAAVAPVARSEAGGAAVATEPVASGLAASPTRHGSMARATKCSCGHHAAPVVDPELDVLRNQNG